MLSMSSFKSPHARFEKVYWLACCLLAMHAAEGLVMLMYFTGAMLRYAWQDILNIRLGYALPVCHQEFCKGTQCTSPEGCTGRNPYIFINMTVWGRGLLVDARCNIACSLLVQARRLRQVSTGS